MNEELLKVFIQKLASSDNPVLASMGAEMTGMSLPTANTGAGVTDPQQKGYGVDQSITAAQCTLRVLNPDGRFSPSNTAGAYAPYLGRNTQLRVSVDAWVDVSGTPTEYDGFRFWGEIAAFKPGWDESGNYRYADITAAGPIRRYSQGNATIGSALRRYYTRLTGSLTPY